MRELRPAGNVATIVIHALEAKSAEEIPARFATAAQAGVTGLIVLDDPLFTSLRDELCRLAAAHRLPALFGDRLFAEAGGLVAYGPDRRANFRRAADYVEKILKGATPADLPVEQSTKFDLVLNLRTAKSFLARAPRARANCRSLLGLMRHTDRPAASKARRTAHEIQSGWVQVNQGSGQ